MGELPLIAVVPRSNTPASGIRLGEPGDVSPPGERTITRCGRVSQPDHYDVASVYEAVNPRFVLSS
jgi:hypothetical protein